jgi:hypothetical protein
MKTPEAKVKAQVDAVLAYLGCQRVNAIAGSFAAAGVSDKLVNNGGVFTAIEVKAAKGRLTALQADFLHNCLLAGGSAAVISPQNLPQLQDWLLRERGARSGELFLASDVSLPPTPRPVTTEGAV